MLDSTLLSVSGSEAEMKIERYYIRDAETNELWCFDERIFGKTQT